MDAGYGSQVSTTCMGGFNVGGFGVEYPRADFEILVQFLEKFKFLQFWPLATNKSYNFRLMLKNCHWLGGKASCYQLNVCQLISGKNIDCHYDTILNLSYANLFRHQQAPFDVKNHRIRCESRSRSGSMTMRNLIFCLLT